nr:MAG TPA: hypothetical protein [Caudoviricetes sp.]
MNKTNEDLATVFAMATEVYRKTLHRYHVIVLSLIALLLVSLVSLVMVLQGNTTKTACTVGTAIPIAFITTSRLPLSKTEKRGCYA